MEQIRESLMDMPIDEMGIYGALIHFNNKSKYTDEEKLNLERENLERMLLMRELRMKGLRYTDIAKQLRCTESTVRRNLAKLEEL